MKPVKGHKLIVRLVGFFIMSILVCNSSGAEHLFIAQIYVRMVYSINSLS